MMIVGCKQGASPVSSASPKPVGVVEPAPENIAGENELARIFEQVKKSSENDTNNSYVMPTAYRDYLRHHVNDVKAFLDKRLASEELGTAATVFRFLQVVADMPAAHSWALPSEMEMLFRSALARPMGPGGPRFPLPPLYIAILRQHPNEAKDFLTAKLQSPDAAVYVTALDFVTAIADIKLVREWAMHVMENAMNDGLASRNTVEATYNRLLRE